MTTPKGVKICVKNEKILLILQFIRKSAKICESEIIGHIELYIYSCKYVGRGYKDCQCNF